MRFLRYSAAPLVALFALFAFSAASAFAGSACSACKPWWHLTSVTRPSTIQPGVAADAVQGLSVSATGGTFVLSRGGEALAAGKTATAALPFDATREALQGSLEEIYGENNVEVTGGPAATAPLTITFKGALADQPIGKILVVPSLTGAGKEAGVTVVNPGSSDAEVVVRVENLGTAPVTGAVAPVRIADTLPPGLIPVGIFASKPNAFSLRTAVPCSLATLSCEFTEVLPAYAAIEVRIEVRVQPTASSGELNQVAVSGGGALAVHLARPIVVSGEPTPFGVEAFELDPEESGGAPAVRAASHPFQITTVVAINQGSDASPLAAGSSASRPAALAKDVVTKLPPGLLGDPVPFATCSLAQFLTKEISGQLYEANACPTQTAVGVASVAVLEPTKLGFNTFTVPLFNLEPAYGEPARFGFYVPAADNPVILDTSLRAGAGEAADPGVAGPDYGVDVTATNITQTIGLTSAVVTFWGTPGDPRHAASRGWGCLDASLGFQPGTGGILPCEPLPVEPSPPALLSMPTSCSGALQASVEADSWEREGFFQTVLPTEFPPALVACNQVPFAPTIQVSPTTNSASAPSGFDFNLDFHDEGLTSPESLIQSQLKNTTVTLPEGFTIDPSAGVGLVGCTEADYARETVDSAPGTGCPNESKLGTVEIETPLLTQKIHGSLFIAQPYENPSGSLVALYIVAKNPETGVLVKLAGKVTPNPVTGQLTTTFENNPQVPFDRFNFHFREGAQAPLITPATCGTYPTTAQLTPWSEPTEALTDSSSFQITSGVGGGPCPSGNVPPFNPGIESGTQNNNAGAYSPFYLHLTRGDADQEISGFSTNLPPGLTGDLTGIPFCNNTEIEAVRKQSGAQAEAHPICPASEVGHTLVGTGVGAVLAYVPGKLYLAGPFDGAPFSLVSVTSAVVGPFDLGTVVLRFGLSINPYTAQVSVSPTSSEPIPTIIKGIVTHVRDIRVYVNRNNFIIDPTSCNPMSISSTLTAAEGGSATVSSPFQAASCASLKFAPKFAVSTSGKTSKANGASLHADLAYPSAPQGTYADIATVKVELPKRCRRA